MSNSLQQFLTKISSNPKQLFLIDGLGALLTAFLLGVILTRFESTFGMPLSVLYTLSLLACGFAIYSFSCYLFLRKNWRPYLKGIAIVNLLYCCVTLVLLFCFWQKLTALGVAYFLLEIIIIVSLVRIELEVISFE